MDGVHDMGGMHGFGAVVTPGSEATHIERWEVRAQMIGLIAGIVSRAAIERLEPAEYLGASYYTRWLLASEKGAIARSFVSETDLASWRHAFAEDPDLDPPVVRTSPEDLEAEREYLSTAPLFSPLAGANFITGDAVRVRRQRPEQHHRCPRYLRGVVGVVEKVVGNDRVPGIGGANPSDEPVYTVQFSSQDLWGQTTELDFELFIDLWQTYLEPA